MITQERLKHLLIYNVEDGNFRWRFGRPGASKESIAGTVVSGYIAIKVDRVRYLAHQLVFLYMTGEVPSEIDHKNRIRDDNRWANLRVASRSENHANVVKVHGSSRSGIRGVAYQPKGGGGGKWFAHIQFKGVREYLGCFSNKEDAAKARRTAEKRVFGRFAAQGEMA